MKTGVHVLEQDLRDAQGWMNSVAIRLNTKNGNLACASLKATLHAMRDQLDPAMAAELGGRLPAVVRGLYYDGWDPWARRRHAARKQDFTKRIDRDWARGPRIKAERAAKAALEVIFERLPASLMRPVIERLPADLHELWPDEPAPYTDLRRVRPLADPEATRRSRATPSRLRRATRRAPGESLANALPERHVSSKRTAKKRRAH
jgi:uncharacterized protein (DUF2267 family)